MVEPPPGGDATSTLFGLGFLGAALLAAAVVALSTAYSVAEAFRARRDIDASLREAPLFYATFGLVVVVAAGVILIPGISLVPVLFLTQALLLGLLPFMRRIGRDPAVMGEHALGVAGRLSTGLGLGLVGASLGALAALELA